MQDFESARCKGPHVKLGVYNQGIKSYRFWCLQSIGWGGASQGVASIFVVPCSIGHSFTPIETQSCQWRLDDIWWHVWNPFTAGLMQHYPTLVKRSRCVFRPEEFGAGDSGLCTCFEGWHWGSYSKIRRAMPNQLSTVVLIAPDAFVHPVFPSEFVGILWTSGALILKMCWCKEHHLKHSPSRSSLFTVRARTRQWQAHRKPAIGRSQLFQPHSTVAHRWRGAVAHRCPSSEVMQHEGAAAQWRVQEVTSLWSTLKAETTETKNQTDLADHTWQQEMSRNLQWFCDMCRLRSWPAALEDARQTCTALKARLLCLQVQLQTFRMGRIGFAWIVSLNI